MFLQMISRMKIYIQSIRFTCKNEFFSAAEVFFFIRNPDLFLNLYATIFASGIISVDLAILMIFDMEIFTQGLVNTL